MINLPTLPLPKLPERRDESHKGDFGRALLIGGSRGMSGAIALAGKAALRSGAGLVSLGVADSCLDTVAALEPSYMTIALPADQTGKISKHAATLIIERASAMTCLACGPGLGRSADLDELVPQLYRELSAPMVIDADALNALAECATPLPTAAGPRVLTPHPGEFRRLVPATGSDTSSQRDAAIQYAGSHNVVLVLKGHRTLITDGTRITYNTTGNPGMATGGAGDVLTGIIVGLLCQGLEPFDAAQLAVYVHGLAGDLAAKRVGQISLIASDLLQYLPKAFMRL